jgi:hypothetical protein
MSENFEFNVISTLISFNLISFKQIIYMHSLIELHVFEVKSSIVIS